MASILAPIPFGMVFGALVQSSGVSYPAAIRGQMLFEKEIMMKFFLGGLTGSTLSLVILSKLYEVEFNRARESRGWGDKGAVSAILGGLIQGVGMGLAGSCPGMAFAQIGSGVMNSTLVYAGGVVGALLYGLAHPTLQSWHVFDFGQTLESRFESMHLEKVFFNGHFTRTGLLFAAITFSAAMALEFLVPWQSDVLTVLGVNQQLALNPSAAGLALGALQVPIFMSLGSLLGASSGYSVTSSQVLRFFPEEFYVQYGYMKNFITSKASWQIGLGIGIIMGAAITSGMAERTVEAIQTGDSLPVSLAGHVPYGEAFLGGLLIVFGARFVGGCASGHGLSGLPSMHVVSWFTVPSMFAGAILTGNIYSYLYGKSSYLL